MVALGSVNCQAPSYGPPEAKLIPQPYVYQYGVQDTYTGSNFAKTETQDDGGNVNGEYSVALPDGRTQIVKYRADDVNGFVADVSYEGVASYPDDVKPSYVAAPAPAYVPVPVPVYEPPTTTTTTTTTPPPPPPPAYTAPPPVYTAPPPAYTAPPPVYTVPPPAYTAPTPAPATYKPPFTAFAPRAPLPSYGSA